MPNIASAPNFNAFNQSVSASNPPQSAGGATSSQNSTLTQLSMTNVSRVTAFGGNQGSRGIGNSSFATTFSVDVATPWSIDGNWVFSNSNAPTDSVTGTMNLALQQQGGPTLYSVTFTPTLQLSSLSGTLSQSGTFQPGFTYSYSITLGEDAGLSGRSGTADINATLSFIPAPGAAAILAPMGVLAVFRRRR